MNPYAQAALTNLEEAIETMRAATRARTWGGAATLSDRALTQAVNARAKLVDAMTAKEGDR
jgi:hypothetical protein